MSTDKHTETMNQASRLAPKRPSGEIARKSDSLSDAELGYVTGGSATGGAGSGKAEIHR